MQRVLVDTDVWSEAFRRRNTPPSAEVQVLHDLILERRVRIIGPILQEILSEIRHEPMFERMKSELRAFLDDPLEFTLFEQAAAYRNLCSAKGVQGSNTDFLICACAVAWNAPILTKDQDFRRYRQFIPIQLLLEPPA